MDLGSSASLRRATIARITSERLLVHFRGCDLRDSKDSFYELHDVPPFSTSPYGIIVGGVLFSLLRTVRRRGSIPSYIDVCPMSILLAPSAFLEKYSPEP